LRIPISRVRSRTATSITFITPMPPMKSVAIPIAPRKYFMPSVMVRKACASSTVSQIFAASSSFGIEAVDARERAPQLRLARLVVLGRRAGRPAAGRRSRAVQGGLFGKSWIIALKGRKSLLMSRPS
jgi:hypothetical protein